MKVCLDLGVPKDEQTSDFMGRLASSDVDKINCLLDACGAMTSVLDDLRSAGIDATIVTDEGD